MEDVNIGHTDNNKIGFAEPETGYGSDHAVATLQELAKNDELFSYPKSSASHLKTVLREIGPMFQYEGEISRLDVPDPRAVQGYIVGVNGREAIVLENDSEVWVNFTDVGEGS